VHSLMPSQNQKVGRPGPSVGVQSVGLHEAIDHSWDSEALQAGRARLRSESHRDCHAPSRGNYCTCVWPHP